VCIPTGPTGSKDASNSFFMTMDDNVDVWAKAVLADPRLAGGFNAVGFSQGNSVIRGYIQKYNDPPVNTFLSVHGTVMGVASFPKCNPSGLLGPVCDLLDRYLVGPLAYTKPVQKLLFQADYFVDPKQRDSKAYQQNSQLAQWNNENPAAVNATIKENFGKVQRWAMVKAEKDTMIFPNDGEWWGQFDTDGKTRLAMNETKMYANDNFGLKTADQAGKIHFESTTGDHLQFTDDELMGWVDKYFDAAGDVQVVETAAIAVAAASATNTTEAQPKYCFYFVGDGDPDASGKQQAPKRGCFEVDDGCKNCLASWRKYPPDASYDYQPIRDNEGCNGTKKTGIVPCPPGLSFYQWF